MLDKKRFLKPGMLLSQEKNKMKPESKTQHRETSTLPWKGTEKHPEKKTAETSLQQKTLTKKENEVYTLYSHFIVCMNIQRFFLTSLSYSMALNISIPNLH